MLGLVCFWRSGKKYAIAAYGDDISMDIETLIRVVSCFYEPDEKRFLTLKVYFNGKDFLNMTDIVTNSGVGFWFFGLSSTLFISSSCCPNLVLSVFSVLRRKLRVPIPSCIKQVSAPMLHVLWYPCQYHLRKVQCFWKCSFPLIKELMVPFKVLLFFFGMKCTRFQTEWTVEN